MEKTFLVVPYDMQFELNYICRMNGIDKEKAILTYKMVDGKWTLQVTDKKK